MQAQHLTRSKDDATHHGHPTLGEEIANAISHGLGLVAAIAFTPLLILRSLEHRDPGAVVGASVFAATMVLLYLASTLYHAIPPGRAKRILKTFDHVAIYLLIAGTYTPFSLGVLRGAWGWSILGVIWGLAAIGIVLKLVGRLSQNWLSTALYVLMGWAIVVAIDPLRQAVQSDGLGWMIAGGLAYSLGVLFYSADRVRYAHFVWHLFVIAGTACHCVAVYGYSV